MLAFADEPFVDGEVSLARGDGAAQAAQVLGKPLIHIRAGGVVAVQEIEAGHQVMVFVKAGPDRGQPVDGTHRERPDRAGLCCWVRHGRASGADRMVWRPQDSRWARWPSGGVEGACDLLIEVLQCADGAICCIGTFLH
ncbi:hypothetical protein DP939_44325 [Spongiactinospora rosea]|uniref:Uncharacterized protein n=1 Tax=Spongiactinospora rosea TaxID=2248750 RepID=A0A366LE64_9ACTN|nr:hypothetical protein DP939_44325 [Spongiactinospora rosea]